jgi:hypothetical protein
MIPIGSFAPLALLTQMPAVVTNDGNHGIITEAIVFKCTQNPADAVINKASSSIVTPTQLPGFGISQYGLVSGVIRSRFDVLVVAALP